MKVVVCNTNESKGGAARAARRISKSLLLNGIDSTYFSLEGNGSKRNSSFFFRRGKFFWSRLEQYPKFFFSNNFSTPFSVSKYSLGHRKYVEELNPDIINLHYINNGLFSVKDIGLFKKPIVWTLHDAWAFTGGCHLPLDCERYTKMCGSCPALNVNKEKDLSRYVWQSKNRFWKDTNLTIVSPSKWLAECAKKSSLFKDCRVEIISNPLDTEIFRKRDRDVVRKELKLEKNKKYILFGAVNAVKDRNKGFEFLKEALEKMKMKGIELLIFGCEKKEDLDLKIPVKSLGFLEKESELAKIYSACDLTAIPSISENQPNIAIESLACGTPVVGFSIKGLEEILDDKRLGYLAKPFDFDDLRKKMERVLKNDQDSDFRAKYVKENFNFLTIGEQYKKLFESIV